MKRPLEDEQDIEFLRQVAITQDKQLKVLVRVLEEKSRLIDELTGRTGDLQATLAFLDAQNETGGKTSSATSDAPTTDDSSKEAAPPTGHGPKAQPKLPRETRLFELDEADKTCPACGGELRPMEDQVETSEMIDVVQVEYRLVEVQRQKYSCACGGCVETAPGPERAVEGGRYSLDFAAHVATSKYLDHLPLHRLCRMMKRAGLEVPPNSLWDQLWRLTRLLRPAYDALHRRLLAEPIIGLDQTSWPKLEAKGKKPWQMWGFTAEGMATYKICRDKSADTMKSLLGESPRILVCDMLSTHGKVARDIEGIELAGCWAHAARRFREAADDFPQAQPIVDRIRRLFDIDGRATSQEERTRLRDGQSRALVKEILRELYRLAIPRTTNLGQAAHYVLKYQEELTRFLEDPRIPLDNNSTERALRGPVVGRKNHYGSKSKDGTEAAAIYYSLFETAKLQDVDPHAYLRAAAIAGRRGEVLLPGALA